MRLKQKAVRPSSMSANLQEVGFAGVCPLDVLVKVIQQVFTLGAPVKRAVQLAPHVEHCAEQLQVRVPVDPVATCACEEAGREREGACVACRVSTQHRDTRMPAVPNNSAAVGRAVAFLRPASSVLAASLTTAAAADASLGPGWDPPCKGWLGRDVGQVNGKGRVAAVERHVGRGAGRQLDKADLAHDALWLCWHADLLRAHGCHTRACDDVHLDLQAVVTLQAGKQDEESRVEGVVDMQPPARNGWSTQRE